MRYVDHDPAAARRAAAVCRDRAAAYEQAAGSIGPAVAGVPWWGEERDRVVRAVTAVCDDLRREAASLRASADLLEAAARAAEQRDADLAHQARLAAEAEAAEAAAAAVRAFTSPGPVWHAPPPPPPAPMPASQVPAGVQ